MYVCQCIYVPVTFDIVYLMKQSFNFHNQFCSPVITDPDDIYTVSNACLKKIWAYDLTKPWLGDALIRADGKWHFGFFLVVV